jgi:hypothetical protein
MSDIHILFDGHVISINLDVRTLAPLLSRLS